MVYFLSTFIGFNLVFFFSNASCLSNVKENSLPYYLSKAWWRIVGFIPFPRALTLCEMQTASFRFELRYLCLFPIVVYCPPTPPNMPFQRRRKCIFHWRGRAWLTIWDRVKIPRYSHKLMHRKRVTSELHGSYFCSMTIKHAIPKTAEVTHSDGQLWGDIVWAIELSYNSKTGSQLVWSLQSFWRPDQFWRPESWRQHVVEKASTRQKALGTPDWAVWRSESLDTRCDRESQHPTESWAPGPPVEQPWRTRKTQRWWP